MINNCQNVVCLGKCMVVVITLMQLIFFKHRQMLNCEMCNHNWVKPYVKHIAAIHLLQINIRMEALFSAVSRVVKVILLYCTAKTLFTYN